MSATKSSIVVSVACRMAAMLSVEGQRLRLAVMRLLGLNNVELKPALMARPEGDNPLR